MPRYILLILFVLYSICVSAQNKPVSNPSVPAPTRTPRTIPNAYQNVKLNYLTVWEPNIPLTDADISSLSSRPNAEVQQQTSYFDRMGRVVQLVKRGFTPMGKDMIYPKEYSVRGKEEQQYLPYPSSTYDGGLRSDAFTEQNTYYTGLSAPGQRFAGEKFYYAEEELENSPLQRKEKDLPIGNSWIGSNRGMATAYLLNTAEEQIIKWSVADLEGSIPQSSGYYGTGLLTKTQTTDPLGKRSVVYRDFEGNIILRKEEAGSGSLTHDGWLCTYFVYDETGRQRFIIPPLAVEKIKSTWSFASFPGVVENLCFYQEYDNRDRVIRDKVPDRGFVENVYDNRNRLVFKQNAKQRQEGMWEILLYDQVNRVTMEGLYHSSKTRSQLQSEMNAAPASGTMTINHTINTYADLVITTKLPHIREYIASNSIIFNPEFDSGTDEFEAYIDPNLKIVNTNVTFVANNPLPSLNPADIIPLTYNYYDSYNWSGSRPFEAAYANKPEIGSNIHKDNIIKADIVPGAKTGTRVRVLGSDKWLTSTEHYDGKGRVIQIISDNIEGGKDVTTKLYDFRDRNISSYHYHTYPGSAVPELRILKISNLDHAGRELSTIMKLNDDPALERVIASSSYFESGELSNKSLGGLRDVAYEYYLNNRLKSINRAYITDAGTSSFGEELYYDYGFTVPLITGEISGVKWRGDGPARAYGYSYDGVGRLMKADFTQLNGSAWEQGNVNFSVGGPTASGNHIKYDANGNIEALHQKGLKGTTSDDVDLLQYVYYDNSNRLKRVTDSKNDAGSLLGDFKEKNSGQEIDYIFDANGNVIHDANKEISRIVYNEIHMPDQITFSGKGNIQFKYTADGAKHQRIVNDQSSGTPKQVKHDYIAGMLYENGVLRYIPHDEGRIRVIQKPGLPVAFWYDYFITDHRGDVRIVYTEQSDLSTYTAGMEPSAAAVENSLFSNIDNTRQQKPVGYPVSDSKNKYAARLNAKFPDKRIGPALVLKVMAGDTVEVKVEAFHKTQAIKQQDPTGPVADMLTPLLAVFAGNSTSGVVKGGQTRRVSPFSQEFINNHYQKLKQKESDTQEAQLRPKAYLNYVLFDEQLNMVERNSGVKQINSSPDVVQALYNGKNAISRNGYLYVYTSNESPQDVYFDNLIVIMSTGRLLEETHYYPFGLTMEGISSKAVTPVTYPENKLRFSGKELQTDEFGNGKGLDWYDFGARMYDPQLGRWFAIDGASNEYSNLSPYHFADNSPIKNKEIDGNRYFPLEWPKPTINPEKEVAKAWNAKYMHQLKMSTPEGQAEEVYLQQKRKEHLKLLDRYRSDVSTPQPGITINSPLEAMVILPAYFIINAAPILGPSVRLLAATRHGNKKGMLINGAFAIADGISLVGGLRSLGNVRAGGMRFNIPGIRTQVPTIKGVYIPKIPLAQQNVAGWDIPLPNPAAGSYAHTTLGQRLGSDGIIYRQSATFTGGSWPLANGKIVPWSRVDWTDHGRAAVHPNPHQHIFNWSGKFWWTGDPTPFP
ncbi:DUF6443 domain-containing protein [Chitinophaga sp. YIM B06452]|uniref:DUF6443 domain-containing protein n=1 Tax=Chitinophaga sp. YIM B06452 TaxID=3082158 RepID=UPI0031FF1DFA